MADDFEPGEFLRLGLHIEIRGESQVVNPAAFDAADMVMNMGCAVEALLGAADVELLDDAALGHDFEITIYRAQADLGQPLANHLVEGVGGWVRGNATQLIEDDLPLSGYPHMVIV